MSLKDCVENCKGTIGVAGVRCCPITTKKLTGQSEISIQENLTAYKVCELAYEDNVILNLALKLTGLENFAEKTEIIVHY